MNASLPQLDLPSPSASADEVLKWAEKQFGANAAIASSFGPEDVVLLHLASQHAPSVKVFTLDTGRLPPETYELIGVLQRRYALQLETFFPKHEAVEKLVSTKGHLSFRESIEARRECCGIRKVEPLKRALAGRAAWITGLRREQSNERGEVATVEHDQTHGLLKLNPLASWSAAQIWDYIREHHLPYNTLHDRGYASIGCAPCTRAIKHHEPERAGRWWWEQSEVKECGLHLAGGALAP
jgi:phosphoadenosine phosphosulfate reductase